MEITGDVMLSLMEEYFMSGAGVVLCNLMKLNEYTYIIKYTEEQKIQGHHILFEDNIKSCFFKVN